MKDEDLLMRLQKGDKGAFEEIFITYYSPLCEYASQYIADSEAEELASDLMLYLWEHRKELMIYKSLKSYLFISVKFRCLNAIKKDNYQRKIHDKIYEKLKDQFENPDYYFVSELSRAIDNAIEELPENYRATFQMSRYGEKTNSQIAEELGVSTKTIEYRITQSLKLLRGRLKEHIMFFVL